MSNYIVTGTELTATANAIRAKTGNSGSLEWDANTGYADDITAIVIGENLQSAANVSFGGTYAFIKVAYPEGSTCTCTKGSTTLTAEDTSGSYTFAMEAPASGTDTWIVSCTNGSASATDSIAISSAEIFSTELDYAYISVTYPAGSTCTCTKGNTILTAPNTSGSYTFIVSVPSSGTDTWSVSCTDGSASATKSVTVSSATTFTVTLVYAYISVTYPEGSTCTCTKGNTTLTASNTSGSYTFIVSVPSNGTDTWTVSITDGTNSKDITVDITSAGTITVSIAYISIITFKILGYYGTNVELEAVDGMTWEEWVNSDYNTIGLSIVRSSYIGSGDYIVTKDNWAFVIKLATIIEGHEYRWIFDN